MRDKEQGTTTRQMTEAPIGAVYVWCNEKRGYPRDLARSLGRDDLRIISPFDVEHGYFRGRSVDVVVDHATRLTWNEFLEIVNSKRTNEPAAKEGK
jgi:hypothetical protein